MWKKLVIFIGVVVLGFNICAYAQDDYMDDFIEYEDYDDDDDLGGFVAATASQNKVDTAVADQMSMEALEDYDMSGSLFEKITMLEQEKVVVQLEKERAQLDLDLDRLNAERIKLQMELDTLSGRAEQQQHELETAKTQLEIQTEKLRKQRNALDFDDEDDEEPVIVKKTQKKEVTAFNKKYKLINVIGVDNQLQATVEELATGQNKRIAVGKDLDGYVVKSISLNDGIVFEKDGVEESLNIGK